jgi:ubiquitin C-terminal hydrolase
VKTVNAERIFSGLISTFNPFNHHQDCHEFLVLILDKLHDEMALMHTGEPAVEEDKSAWNEVGAGSL